MRTKVVRSIANSISASLKAEAELLTAEDELNEAYAAVAKDSITIPQILVSPARSAQGTHLTDSQLILLKGREMARDIIEQAIELNTGVEGSEADLLSHEANFILDSTESQMIFQAREIVHDIIETALEINDARTSMGIERVLDLKDPKVFHEVIDLREDVQEQVIEKAKDLVHDAVSKAVNMAAGVQTGAAVAVPRERKSSKGSRRALSSIESQMTMFKAQEIVNFVVGEAIRMNLRKIQSELVMQSNMKQKTEVL